MFCNKCGTEFLGVDICPKCGHIADAAAMNAAAMNAAAVQMTQSPQAQPYPAMRPIQPEPARTEPQPQPASQISYNTRKKPDVIFIVKIVLCSLGILVGALSIINTMAPGAFFGLEMDIIDYTVEYVSEKAYGGDAYTGIQNAAAAAANNTRKVVHALEGGFNQFYDMIQVAIGSFMVLVFGLKLCDAFQKHKEIK